MTTEPTASAEIEKEAKRIVDKIMQHMDIDLMNVWIAEMNELRWMLKCGGIEPGWGEMEFLSYPSDQ